ncbi:HD domain-containing protein [Leifsonia sp. F6_8S_P_1B]|uniref:HD domain-containing protein n=1 Tax=Leifsonia williamsii TaxID=3035919 RepID=A0ABT8K8N5_9MICO|nr:HD domain-containing protein [Leifsonia williamsii]MDN4613826.1 HD domain-containing protein [Leifsonia williamsii]
MSRIIAGVALPETPAAEAARTLVEAQSSPLLYDHSLRVFLFGSLHARARGLEPDPELLYVASLFHDSGLLVPPAPTPHRFEVDGADLAHAFALDHGFSEEAARLVWEAVALHTTPEIPGRMGPEVAAMNLGVLTDAVGAGLDALDPAAVDEILAAYPRDDFKRGFLATFHEGLKHRPGTTYGTINADILEHFEPGFRRGSMVERILSSWE